MAGQFCESFDSYGTRVGSGTKMLDGTPWAYVENDTIWPDPDPSGVGAPVFRVVPDGNNSNIGDNRLALPIPRACVGVGARYYHMSLPVGLNERTQIICFRTPANGRMYELAVEPNGALSVYRNSVTLVATTVVPFVAANRWQHFAMMVDVTTGEIRVQREGTNVAALAVTDGAPPGGLIGIVAFSGRFQFGGTTLYMKDLTIWDDQGSQNNDFIGPCAVLRLPVDGDVSSGWTPSTGIVQWSLLNEAPPNDANFISADDTPPAAAVFEFQDLPPDIVAVRWLQTYARIRKTDGGDATVQTSLTSGGSDFNGQNYAVTTAFSYWLDISELDPDTAAPWSPAAVDAATISVNRTS